MYFLSEKTSKLLEQLKKGMQAIEHRQTEEPEKVVEIVRHYTHRSQSNTYSDSIRTVQDEDILDHMGTTEIWMNFLYSCNQDKGIVRSLEFYNGGMFEEYSCGMMTRLNYDILKEILNEKLQFVRNFVFRLEKEANGELIWSIS
jgi:histidyl-tRNA synthetase